MDLEKGIDMIYKHSSKNKEQIQKEVETYNDKSGTVYTALNEKYVVQISRTDYRAESIMVSLHDRKDFEAGEASCLLDISCTILEVNESIAEMIEIVESWDNEE